MLLHVIYPSGLLFKFEQHKEAGPQPADIFGVRQNGCNLLFNLTTKHAFENAEVQLPGCPPPGCGPVCKKP